MEKPPDQLHAHNLCVQFIFSDSAFDLGRLQAIAEEQDLCRLMIAAIRYIRATK